MFGNVFSSKAYSAGAEQRFFDKLGTPNETYSDDVTGKTTYVYYINKTRKMIIVCEDTYWPVTVEFAER